MRVPVVEVRRVGGPQGYARLFVNGFGVASWPLGVPCANDSTAEEYALGVARELRRALASAPVAQDDDKYPVIEDPS